MTSLNNLRVFSLVGALGLVVAAQSGAVADPISDFYKSKQLKIAVGSSSGGGYDTYARTLARHINKHIPGKPRMLVQNMVGAGGIIAANFVYDVAPQDGSVIGAFQRTIPLDKLLGHKGPKYDPLKFQWLGSITNEAGVLVALKTAKVKKLEDAFSTKMIAGSTGPTDSEIYPAMLDNIMGTKIEIIGGYPGSAQIHLALQRGEIEAYSQSWSSFKSLAGKRYKTDFTPLVQLSLKPLPEMAAMGVPMIMDFVDRKHVLAQYSVEDAKTWWRLMLTSKAMGRPYAVGPGVPADKVKALQKAFMDTMSDDGFIADAKKQRREVSPINGAEVHEMIAALATAPQSTIDKVKELIRYHGPKKMVKVEMAKHTGKVTKTVKGGRQIVIDMKGKAVKAKVSGSRTKVTIAGKKASRKSIKTGMTCTFTYPGPGSEAKKIDCK